MKKALIVSLALNAVVLGLLVQPGSPVAIAGFAGGGAATENGDVNGDGGLDISDAVYILVFLFTGGPDPVKIECSDPPACPDLNPIDDGAATKSSVVISEIQPDEFVELYNSGTSAVDLSTSTMQLCSPFSYAAVKGLTAKTSIPAKGYVTLSWPVTFSDTLAGGEVLLFRDSFFSSNESILDFVCWGTNPHASRVIQALAAGKWTGACAPPIAGGSIHRKVGTKGTSAADYDVTTPPSPTNCP